MTNSDPEGKELLGVVPKACLPSKMVFMLRNWHLFRKSGPHSFVRRDSNDVKYSCINLDNIE